MQHPSRRGFTLVELSIVLVVVALLTGAVFAGKNMVRAAQLRSTITDAQLYLSAINSFRTQYKLLPGDLPNATKYWSQNTSCGGASTTEESTCDGNGDGIVAQGTSEEFRSWQHLRNAGMIDPKLSGVAGGGGANDSIPGTNVPAGRIANTGYALYYFNSSAAGDNYITVANYSNMLTWGAKVANSEPTTAAITPEDAFSIDTKADDGKPATGNWVANSTGGGVWSASNACTTNASAVDYSGSYNLSSAAVACSFFILTGV